VARPDETFIVRVRHEERDAVLEQPRLSRRRQVPDVSLVGPLILRWLEPRTPADARREPKEVPDEI
jgi:hypothetical protein